MIRKRPHLLWLLASMVLLLGAVALPAHAQKNAHERNHASVKAAFRDVVAQTHKSVVIVYSDGNPIAMGAIVRKDGHILTKGSELHGDLECLLYDSRRLPAKLVGYQKKNDLALLKIDAQNLLPVTWAKKDTPVGSWLTTPGLTKDPLAIGVASVKPRTIRPQSGVLGIQFDPLEIGSRIDAVFPGSGAQKAGLRVNDIIREANGKAIENIVREVEGREVHSRVSLKEIIGGYQPGERVHLVIERGQQELRVTATLGWLSSLMQSDSHANMDITLGGPLSERRAGFEKVLQHDTILRPRDCGGPIVNLDGETVGINIARAGRTSSFAIPASVVQAVLPDLLSGKLPPPDGFLEE